MNEQQMVMDLAKAFPGYDTNLVIWRDHVLRGFVYKLNAWNKKLRIFGAQFCITDQEVVFLKGAECVADLMRYKFESSLRHMKHLAGTGKEQGEADMPVCVDGSSTTGTATGPVSSTTGK